MKKTSVARLQEKYKDVLSQHKQGGEISDLATVHTEVLDPKSGT